MEKMFFVFWIITIIATLFGGTKERLRDNGYYLASSLIFIISITFLITGIFGIGYISYQNQDLAAQGFFGLIGYFFLCPIITGLADEWTDNILAWFQSRKHCRTK